MNSQPLSFDDCSEEEDQGANMGNMKFPKDWKFYCQLGVLLVALGGSIQAFRFSQESIHELQVQIRALEENLKQKNDLIIRMDGKFDLLNLQIRQLHELLEAKKIVNAAMADLNNLAGEKHTEK